MCYLSRAEYARTRELSTEILRVAREANDPRALVTAHYMLGTVLVYLGEITAAREQYVQGIALSDEYAELTLADGRDPGVSCRAQMARVLWLLGYPEQAVAMSDAAQQRARERAQTARGGVHAFPGHAPAAVSARGRRDAACAWKRCKRPPLNTISRSTGHGPEF
jgi:hypothetical protein